jgi:sugar (pentulose or hexulose) kinase
VFRPRLEVIHIVGGGSRNRLLNQLTANVTARRVVAGPAEATAAGNALVQAWGAEQVVRSKNYGRWCASRLRWRSLCRKRE